MAATDKPWETDLDKNAWQSNGMCTCGGVLQYKYLCAGKELRIMPHRNMFVVRHKGQLLASGKLDELKEKVEGLTV